MNKLVKLQSQLADAQAQLAANHPNLCTKCGGWGGSISSSGDGWHEPVSQDWDDCEACLAQGLNPLDITSSLTDEEAEAHIEMVMEDTHPLLSKLNELELEIHYEEMYLDYQEEIEIENVLKASREEEQSYEDFYNDKKSN